MKYRLYINNVKDEWGNPYKLICQGGEYSFTNVIIEDYKTPIQTYFTLDEIADLNLEVLSDFKSFVLERLE